MANPHPPPFSTGIDATDVDRWLKNILVPQLKTVGVAMAEAAITLLGESLKTLTPEHIDAMIDIAMVETKAALRREAGK